MQFETWAVIAAVLAGGAVAAVLARKLGRRCPP